MTKQPIIGIAGNRRVNPENGLLRDYVPHGFVEGVKRAGGLPLILPISDTDTARQYISMVDKLFYLVAKMLILLSTGKKTRLKIMMTSLKSEIYLKSLFLLKL